MSLDLLDCLMMTLVELSTTSSWSLGEYLLETFGEFETLEGMNKLREDFTLLSNSQTL